MKRPCVPLLCLALQVVPCELFCQSNAPPTVRLISPVDGLVLTAPAKITLEADTQDSDGAVVEVSFFQGSNLLATDRFIPYRLVLSNLPPATNTFTAQAKDNSGLISTSSPAQVFVRMSTAPNTPPSITILKPTDGAVITAPTNITIETEAFDSDGVVRSVDFFVGRTFWGTVTNSPFTLIWSNVAVGSYQITARATDDRATVTDSAPVGITVISDRATRPFFTLTDLTSLGGETSVGAAINNAGQVTGSSFTTNNLQHAFLWEAGVMTDLRDLGGETEGKGLSELGVVVGDSVLGGGSQVRPFVWTKSSGLSELTSLGGRHSRASDVNDKGQVVGFSLTLNDETHPVLWENGAITDLLNGLSGSAAAINNNSQVVGTYAVALFLTNHAFLWENGQLTDVGTLGGNNSSARAINQEGQIVGDSELSPGIRHAFLWQSNQMQDLGTLGGTESSARGINRSGQTVGEARDANGDRRAFLRQKAVMFNLNHLIPTNQSWTLLTAEDINDQGMIVGTGVIRMGDKQFQRAFLLTPLPSGWPIITLHPQNQTVLEGSSVSFQVTAEGQVPLIFQWQLNGTNLKDGTNLIGAKAAHLTITNVQLTNAGNYTVVVWNAVGTAVSLAATLRVLQPVEPPGTKLWEFQTGGSVFSSPAIGDDGTIFVGSSDKNLYAINPDGTKKWNFTAGDPIAASPAIGPDGTIYVGERVGGGVVKQNKFYAVNPDSTRKWALPLNVGDTSAAIGADGAIYVMSTDGRLNALNRNGTTKWIFATQSGPWISSPSISADGIIYTGTGHGDAQLGFTVGRFFAIDPDGNLKWSFSDRGPFTSAPSIGADGTIYFGSSDNEGKVYAFDPEGNQKWEFRVGSSISMSPSIGLDGTIYVAGMSPVLFAINPDGTRKWTFPTQGTIQNTPAVGRDGILYFGSLDGKTYAVDSSGMRIWAFEALFNNNGFSSPAIGRNGVVYFGSLNSLFAVQASSTLAEENWSMFRRDLRHTAKTPSGSAPTIFLTSPTNGSTFLVNQQIALKATAFGGTGGVVRVDFFSGSALLATVSSPPYSFTWTNAPSGNHVLTARANDTTGTSTTSQSVIVTVNQPPAVEIANPSVGAQFIVGDNITITARVSDTDGAVRQVDFFRGTDVLLGTATTSPFSVTWSNVPLGSFVITAKAIDNFGGTTTSDGVSITVNPRFYVKVIGPTDGATFFVPTNITLIAEAVQLDGSISKVEFFQGATKLGEAMTRPYTASWSNVVEGAYSIYAVATDDRGMVKNSVPVGIKVLNPVGRFDTYWRSRLGDWFTPSNWTIRPPAANDTAFIDNNGSSILAEDPAVARRLVIGSSNAGHLEHTAGRLSVTEEIIIGERSASSGSYSLDHDATVSTGTMAVGLAGEGSFVQSGGTNQLSLLVVAGDVTGRGSYLLAGGHIVANTEVIVAYNVGEFIQTGGTNKVSSSLTVGGRRDSTGLYELRHGLLQVPFEIVGDDNAKMGTFKQSGGNNSISGELRVGNFGSGTFEISSGTLLTKDLVVGSGAFGKLQIASPDALIIVSNRLEFGPSAFLAAVPGSVIHVKGTAIDNKSIRPDSLSDTTNLNLAVTDNPTTPLTLEVASNPARGFEQNFTLGSLTIGGTKPGSVRLEDRRDNDLDGNINEESLLVHVLAIGEDSSLDFNGLSLYVRDEAVGLAGPIRLSGGFLSAENGLELAPSGSLTMDGIVLGNVTNGGRIHSAIQRGRLEVFGDLEQTDGGIIEITIAGKDAGLQFDQVQIAGMARLGGVIKVNLADNFAPALGDTFQVLNFAERTGAFAYALLPRPTTNGVAFQLRIESDSVVVEAVRQPELQIIAPITLNLQSGLFEQSIEVKNVGSVSLTAVRVLIRNMPLSTRVYNVSGQENGDYFVRHNLPLAPGESVVFRVEYYVPDRTTIPNPTIIADAAYSPPPLQPTGTILSIDRSLKLVDSTFLIEFSTLLNRTYYVQYSGDMDSWKTAQPPVIGTGSRIQWIDNGPPKTESHPQSAPGRFYRVVLVP